LGIVDWFVGVVTNWIGFIFKLLHAFGYNTLDLFGVVEHGAA
jgi:hypothetical protein